MSQIIDIFSYSGEEDILEMRLNILKDIVDYFIIVEAGKSQSDKIKPRYFLENREKFKEFQDKIILLEIEDSELPSNISNSWNIEHFHRNYGILGLDSVPNIKENSYILLNDLDEIPNPEIVKLAIDYIKLGEPIIAIEQFFHAYKLDLIASDRYWIGTCITTVGSLKNQTLQNIRQNKDYYPNLFGGNHLSYIYENVGEGIRRKAEFCIEPPEKSRISSAAAIQEVFDNYKINNLFYFIHSEDLSRKQTKFHQCDISILPQYIQDNKSKYHKLFL